MPQRARSGNVPVVRNGDLHPFQYDITTVRSSCPRLLYRNIVFAMGEDLKCKESYTDDVKFLG